MQIHSFPDYPILLVDDEAKALESLTITLEFNGVNNLTCMPGRDNSHGNPGGE